MTWPKPLRIGNLIPEFCFPPLNAWLATRSYRALPMDECCFSRSRRQLVWPERNTNGRHRDPVERARARGTRRGGSRLRFVSVTPGRKPMASIEGRRVAMAALVLVLVAGGVAGQQKPAAAATNP